VSPTQALTLKPKALAFAARLFLLLVCLAKNTREFLADSIVNPAWLVSKTDESRKTVCGPMSSLDLSQNTPRSDISNQGRQTATVGGGGDGGGFHLP
jgi:hypothetical protein